MSARPHWLVATAIAFTLQGGIGKAAGSTAESQLQTDIVVEQADILMMPGARPLLQGYLVIWNGSSQAVTITDVRGDSFEAVALTQTMTVGGETQAIARANLVIPARSELLMRPGGVYLSIDPGQRTVRVGEQVDLEIRFADGASETITAVVEPQGAAIEDHHHGMQ